MPPRKPAYRPKRRNNGPREPLPEVQKRTDVVELKGTIDEALPNAQYRVTLEGGQGVLAHLSGKMRLHHIKVLAGDTVTIQLSPYDLTKGRIVRRER